jgi:hypothetical protein
MSNGGGEKAAKKGLSFNWLTGSVVAIGGLLAAFTGLVKAIDGFRDGVCQAGISIVCKKGEFEDDDADWRSARSTFTIKALEDYKIKWPGGLHVSEANRLIRQIEERDAWLKAREADTPDAYRLYLRRWADGAHEMQARRYLNEHMEYEHWQQAREADTEEALNAFLETWPDGANSAAAKRRLAELRVAATRITANNKKEETAWSEARKKDSIDAYSKYLEEASYERYRDEARQRIRELEDDKNWAQALSADSPEGYQSYLNTTTLGSHRAEAQKRLAELGDLAVWHKAQRVDTVSALKAYIDDQSTGQFVGEARRRLAELTTASPDNVRYFENWDFPAPRAQDDLKWIKKTSLESCLKQCIARRDCIAFTFNNNTRSCFLKDRYFKIQKYKGATSAVVRGQVPDELLP